LSVLDQSPIPEGHTAGDALRNSIDLAHLADKLGFERYWVAEHHGTPGLACNSPEVLMGPIAAATRRIRVGSGGVMLPHYSPLKVAENFGMLSSLYPGRIDLGIGRAAGTSRNVAFALQRDRRQPAPDDFPEQFRELLGYLSDAPEPHTAMRHLGSYRATAAKAEPWLLGSSPQSGIWAAQLGLPYAFADFINPQGSAIANHYVRAFQPSQFGARPRLAVAAWVICAPTDEEAERLSLSARMMMAMLLRGMLIPVPTIERAKEFLKSEGVPAQMLAAGRRFITGSPTKVRSAIEELAGEYRAEEVLLVNILHSHEARRRSYELIAKEFSLSSALNAAVA
jgi:luciferase family oxidoreductase group 1